MTVTIEDDAMGAASGDESGLRLRPLESGLDSASDASAFDEGHAPPASPYPIESLGAGIRVDAIARTCRKALVEFLVGADSDRGGWGKAEFDDWVAELWAQLGTPSAAEDVGRAHRGSFGHTARARQSHIGDELYRALLREAHARALSVLAQATPPARDSSFTISAIRRGFVVQVCDEEGKLGWVPVDVPGMWPVERVLALAATDFLSRPRDYDRPCAVPLAMWRLGRVAGEA
jgi:hypothetical protein